MQLRSMRPRVHALRTLSLLQDGHTLDSHSHHLGEVRLSDIALVGADQAGRAWQFAAAAVRRGGERVVERACQVAGPVFRRARARRGDGARPMVVQPAVSPEVSQRRAEAMRGLFPKLASWYEHRSYMAEMREVDRYLSQSTDLVDLERRLRDIDRRTTGSGWF